MLKKYFAAGRIHFLAYVLQISIALILLSFTHTFAASWQWSASGANERITINLDENQAPLQAKRNGLHSVLLPLPLKGAGIILNGNGPALGKIVAGVVGGPDGITLQLQSSAFGYLLRQPTPKQIVIDIFSDPLGARWQADGKLAPVGTKPTKVDKLPSPIPSVPTTPAVAPTTPAITPAPPTLPANNTQPSTPFMPPEEIPTASKDTQTPLAPTEQPGIEQFSMPPENAEPSLPLPNDAQLPLQDANGVLRDAQVPQRQILQPVQPPPSKAMPQSSLSPQDKLDDIPGSMLVAIADPTLIAAQDESSSALNSLDEAKPNPLASDAKPRGKAIGAQEIVGSINTAGPESWPEDDGISTVLQNQPATPAATGGEDVKDAAQPSESTNDIAKSSTTTENQSLSPVDANTNEKAQTQVSSDNIASTTTPAVNAGVRQDVNTEGRPEADTVEAEPRPVIYVDEEGNVIEKPPVPEELFDQALVLMDDSKYTEAIAIWEQLRAMPNIKREMREQVLYNLSDALFALYDGKPLEGFEPISSITSEAMNVNLRSSRVPDALYRLGLVNLGVGNFAEAEGYFKALKRRYPDDINVPAAFYQLGKAQFEKGLYAEAEKNFRMVVNEYPDASALDEATTALVKALTRLGEYKEALVYADFAGKRWARYYVDDPDYLSFLAEIDYNLGDKEGAMADYWLLYNLDPQNERSPDVMAKIGDLYFETGRPKAALEVFSEIETRFPGTDAAALAFLRLSEKGIYDSPINMAEMFAVFENPGKPLPQVAYKKIQKDRPTDKRSITSQLKYAIWQLWNNEYTDAMGSAGDFLDLYPDNTDAELAKDVMMRGFMADLKNSLAEENYGRVLILWNGFPVVRERYGPIDADLRNALGRGYLERGEDEKALEMLAEFLKTPMDPRYSETTFALYFNKYLESGNWNAMLDLGELVKNWTMSPSMRGQLDYALALSAENLGLRERSLGLWKNLAVNNDIQLYQRAYATYFLAKDAEGRQDIKEAYSYNLKTLDLFEALRQERSERADADRIKEAINSLMDITEVSNRIPEALDWVARYNEFAPEGSPEYPGLRFREARLYRKLGNNERARLLLEIIVNNYAESPFAAAANTELSTFEMSRDLRNFLPGGTGAQPSEAQGG